MRRLLAASEHTIHEALLARHGEQLSQALIDGDPEVDMELVGRPIERTSTVYLDSSSGVWRFVPDAAALQGLKTNASEHFGLVTSDGAATATPVARRTTIVRVSSPAVKRTGEMPAGVQSARMRMVPTWLLQPATRTRTGRGSATSRSPAIRDW